MTSPPFSSSSSEPTISGFAGSKHLTTRSQLDRSSLWRMGTASPFGSSQRCTSRASTPSSRAGDDCHDPTRTSTGVSRIRQSSRNCETSGTEYFISVPSTIPRFSMCWRIVGCSAGPRTCTPRLPAILSRAHLRTMRLNLGLLQTGAILGLALTRLEGSLVTSLTYVGASEEVARCRTPNR